MTYAPARLLLGIFGVGSVVVRSTMLLLSQLPLTMLPDARRWSDADLTGLISLFGCLVAALFPFDLMGGFVLPNRWRPDTHDDVFGIHPVDVPRFAHATDSQPASFVCDRRESVEFSRVFGNLPENAGNAGCFAR